MSDDVKMWGDEEYWGIGYEYDPQFFLTESQIELQKKLIELCRTTLSVNALESDKGYIFPRKNFEALASMGLLGLFVPKELGGMGENHVCMAMVVETVARYGCPSTAMCLTMHYGACSLQPCSAITTTKRSRTSCAGSTRTA
jgi:alkylation response protein AidB-like acyl-CoA dehydrogenase